MILYGNVYLRDAKGLLTNDSGVTEREFANNLVHVFRITKPTSTNIYLVGICKKNI